MSCFADWSKCSHVTLIVIIWSTRHGHLTFSSVENVAPGLRPRARATFSTSGLSYFSVHSRPCIICKMLAMISVALWHCQNDIPRIRWETSAGVGTPLPPGLLWAWCDACEVRKTPYNYVWRSYAKVPDYTQGDWWSDVTASSMVTIRSPFCGYNMI